MEEEDIYSDTSKRLTVAILLMILLTVIVLIIVYRKNVKKKELQKDIDDIRNRDYSDRKPVNLTEQFLTCENCGGKIPLDSKFCHLCGTEIIKEE